VNQIVLVQRSIGENIRLYREEMMLTQKELSVKSGIHEKHIGVIESGGSNFTIGSLVAITRALGINVQDVLRVRT